MGWINIRHLGANGDGVTDDAPAIQSAIDLAAAHGGGTIFIPAVDVLGGEAYVCASPLTIAHNGINIVGDGYGSRLDIQHAGVGIEAEDARTKGTYATYTFCKFENFTIYSNDIATVGLDFSGFAYSIFRDMIFNIKGANVNLRGAGYSGSSPYYNCFSNIAIIGGGSGAGGIGILLDVGHWGGGSNGTNACNFTDIRRIAGIGVGIDIRAGNENFFNNVQIESAGTAGMRLGYLPDG